MKSLPYLPAAALAAAILAWFGAWVAFHTPLLAVWRLPLVSAGAVALLVLAGVHPDGGDPPLGE